MMDAETNFINYKKSLMVDTEADFIKYKKSLEPIEPAGSLDIEESDLKIIYDQKKYIDKYFDETLTSNTIINDDYNLEFSATNLLNYNDRTGCYLEIYRTLSPDCDLILSCRIYRYLNVLDYYEDETQHYLQINREFTNMIILNDCIMDVKKHYECSCCIESFYNQKKYDKHILSKGHFKQQDRNFRKNR